jgi:hypothetical protein
MCPVSAAQRDGSQRPVVLRSEIVSRAGRAPTRCVSARENGAGGVATDTRWGSQRPMSNHDSRGKESPGTCPHCETRIERKTLADHLHYCDAARAAGQAALTDSFGGMTDE